MRFITEGNSLLGRLYAMSAPVGGVPAPQTAPAVVPQPPVTSPQAQPASLPGQLPLPFTPQEQPPPINFADYPSATFTITSDGENAQRSVVVRVVQTAPGTLELFPEGYGEHDAANGYGSPVFLDFWDDRLRVVVSPDINVSGNPTVLDIEGAQEHLRTGP